MKILTALLLALPLCAAAPKAAKMELKNDDQKVLYALGMWLGGKVAAFNLDAKEGAIVIRGLSDSINEKKPLVDYAVYGRKIDSLAKDRKNKDLNITNKDLDITKKKGKAACDKLAKEKGAVRTKSGLVYKITKKGEGPLPAPADSVKVHYHGTHIDGTVFDSSLKRDPYEMSLKGGVIQCWLEAMALFNKGTKATLLCPPEIAYGDSGARMPAGSTLRFDVEVVEIVKKK